MSEVNTSNHASSDDRPKALVITAPGINCDGELAVWRFEAAGAAPDVRAARGPDRSSGRSSTEFSLIGLPGGFSYGDDGGAGRVLAQLIRQGLYGALAAAVERGVPMIAPCNGFQIAVQAGLLPGTGRSGENWPVDAGASDRGAGAERARDGSDDVWTGEWRFRESSRCIWTAGLGAVPIPRRWCCPPRTAKAASWRGPTICWPALEGSEAGSPCGTPRPRSLQRIPRSGRGNLRCEWSGLRSDAASGAIHPVVPASDLDAARAIGPIAATRRGSRCSENAVRHASAVGALKLMQ